MEIGFVESIRAAAGEDASATFNDQIIETQTAEKLGFKSIMVGQHYLSHPFQSLHPMPQLGRLSAYSGNMRIVALLLLPLLQPVDVAEQTASLDVISGGRFILAAALGYRDQEFAAFGVAKSTRVARLVESMTIIDELLSGKRVTFVGRHFKLRDVSLSTMPVQKPRPPIWMAGQSDGAVTRAAEMADAWIGSSHESTNNLKRLMQLYERVRLQGKKPVPRELPLNREIFIANSTDDAYRQAKIYMGENLKVRRSWGQQYKADPRGKQLDVNKPLDELAQEWFICGDVGTCLDKLASIEEDIGFNHVILKVRWPGMKHTEVMKSLTLIGEKVIPYFSRTS